MNKTIVTKNLETKTLVIERSFAAPKEKVWQAYAEQSWFEKWWGPEGWETVTKEFNFKVGGRLHYGMKCIDPRQTEWFGKESWGLMEIEQIDEPHQFTAQDYFSNPEGTVMPGMPAQRFIVELVENNGVTRLICTCLVDTVDQFDELIKMGMIEGFSSQLNKLETLVTDPT